MNATKFAGLALLVALAGCGESVTAPTMAPRFDGGHTFGGGLAVETPPPPGLDTAGPTCEEDDRGGHTFGGGLYMPGPCPDTPPTP
jgi:hypothetical protein